MLQQKYFWVTESVCFVFAVTEPNQWGEKSH